MRRITILEPTGLLGIRMDRLLTYYGFDDNNVIKKIKSNSVAYTFKDSDLIIIDMDDPKNSFLKIIEAIKKVPELKDVGIILLSGNMDIKRLKEGLRLGCSDFIVKPFNDELLIDKVHKYFEMSYHFNNSTQEEYTQEADSHTSLIWQRDYAIGVEEIDNEHKQIMENYRELYSKMRLGGGQQYYPDLLNFLEKYVNDHFAHEERYQSEIHFTDIENHIQKHDAFRKKVYDLIDEHKGKEITNKDLIRINILIRNWLLHHILVEDNKIGVFVNSQS